MEDGETVQEMGQRAHNFYPPNTHKVIEMSTLLSVPLNIYDFCTNETNITNTRAY